MKKIRTMLDEVNEIHLFQSQRVAQAAQQAHLRSKRICAIGLAVIGRTGK